MTDVLEETMDLQAQKPILRTLLKRQMRHLVEDMSAILGEETLVLAVNTTTGSVSNISSELAKGFIETRGDIKEEFQSHCLKNNTADARCCNGRQDNCPEKANGSEDGTEVEMQDDTYSEETPNVVDSTATNKPDRTRKRFRSRSESDLSPAKKMRYSPEKNCSRISWKSTAFSTVDAIDTCVNNVKVEEESLEDLCDVYEVDRSNPPSMVCAQVFDLKTDISRTRHGCAHDFKLLDSKEIVSHIVTSEGKDTSMTCIRSANTNLPEVQEMRDHIAITNKKDTELDSDAGLQDRQVICLDAESSASYDSANPVVIVSTKDTSKGQHTDNPTVDRITCFLRDKHVHKTNLTAFKPHPVDPISVESVEEYLSEDTEEICRSYSLPMIKTTHESYEKNKNAERENASISGMISTSTADHMRLPLIISNAASSVSSSGPRLVQNIMADQSFHTKPDTGIAKPTCNTTSASKMVCIRKPVSDTVSTSPEIYSVKPICSQSSLSPIICISKPKVTASTTVPGICLLKPGSNVSCTSCRVIHANSINYATCRTVNNHWTPACQSLSSMSSVVCVKPRWSTDSVPKISNIVLTGSSLKVKMPLQKNNVNTLNMATIPIAGSNKVIVANNVPKGCTTSCLAHKGNVDLRDNCMVGETHAAQPGKENYCHQNITDKEADKLVIDDNPRQYHLATLDNATASSSMVDYSNTSISMQDLLYMDATAYENDKMRHEASNYRPWQSIDYTYYPSKVRNKLNEKSNKGSQTLTSTDNLENIEGIESVRQNKFFMLLLNKQRFMNLAVHCVSSVETELDKMKKAYKAAAEFHEVEMQANPEKVKEIKAFFKKIYNYDFMRKICREYVIISPYKTVVFDEDVTIEPTSKGMKLVRPFVVNQLIGCLEKGQNHCPICDGYVKEFCTTSKLIDHMRLHTGIKLYKCFLCCKRFMRKQGLNDHVKLHTNGNCREPQNSE